jgi:serine/threonine-protein kinase HipA
MGAEDVLAGRLWSHRSRGKESATFSYDNDYLARPGAYALDPTLPLSAGPQQTPAGHATFGAFSDCAPDRWGRRLIQRRERQRAKAEDRSERSIGEIDYLLGVRDDMRQGALRFRDPENGTFLAAERDGVPDLVELPRLLGAAERLERDEAEEPDLEMLLHGGSSLGGARPKAHVRDQNGRVAIAKFPRDSSDEWDMMRWESAALSLAERAGIAVPHFSLHQIGDKPVLIVDRFDRHEERRIGYVSAMSMLEAKDGDEGSYLEIADVIERHSVQAATDLSELWRRIAFSILISNTDDHLRNHGFLRTSSAGWSLSPAFDLNPNPRPGPKYLTTAIDVSETAASIETLVDVAPYFRLTESEAAAILAEVEVARDQWRRVAQEAGLSRAEIGVMEPAFEHEQVGYAQSFIAAAA